MGKKREMCGMKRKNKREKRDVRRMVWHLYDIPRPAVRTPGLKRKGRPSEGVEQGNL